MAIGYHLLQDASFADASPVLGGGAWADTSVYGSGFVPGDGPGGLLPSCVVLPASDAAAIPIDDGNGLSIAETGSFGCWIKFNPAISSQCWGYDAASDTYSFWHDSAGNIKFRDINAHEFTIDASAAAGAWCMVGFSVAPTVGDTDFSTIKTYYNGTLQNTLGPSDFAGANAAGAWVFSAVRNFFANGTPSICGVHGEAGVAWDAAQFAAIYAMGVDATSAAAIPGRMSLGLGLGL